MKKFIRIIVITTISLGILISTFTSFKNFVSLTEQNLLINDFNSGKPQLNYDFVKDFEDQIPNIVATTLPIKSMKAYYLIKEGYSDSALKYLWSDKSNPYIHYTDLLIGEIYLKKQILDSAEIYLKKAFYGLPNNTNHRILYFNLLSKTKDSSELYNSLEYLKTINNELNLTTWINYLSSMSSIVGPGNSKLIRTLDSLKLKYPNDKNLNNDVSHLVLFGIKNVSESLNLSIQAEKLFEQKKYKQSVALFMKAIEKNPEKYEYYESLAITHMKLKNNDLAEIYFRNAINKRPFQIANGKSEFYLGALLLNKNQNDSACVYFRRSLKYDYKESIGFIKTYCN